MRNPLLLLFFLYINAAFGQLSPLKVSDNQRFLTTKDNKPFFWLADTGWEAFHKLNHKEADFYFQKREEQGFTVIQTVVLAELDGLQTPNANGDLPLINLDPTIPNEAYFRYLDTFVDLAAMHGLYVALLPTWGDKLYKNSWGTGPEIFNPANAKIYGKWLGNRYKYHTNIVWVIGGDRDPRENSLDLAVWRAMAKGVTEGVGNPDKILMTFHPQPNTGGSSSYWFHDDNWLDINMLQTGHCQNTPMWDDISIDYNRQPIKPVFNGESIYEAIQVCFNAKELGYGSAYDVRKSAYLSVFAGACGHTYGCGPVIFFGEKKSNLFADLYGWKEALDLAGAKEMKYLRTLIESRPMLERVPDQSLILNEKNGNYDRIQATRGPDYAFIYSAAGHPIQVKLDVISGEKITAHWFDPRSGKNEFIGYFENKGTQLFTPPLPSFQVTPTQREDCVLVLDDASKGYSMPRFKADLVQKNYFELDIRLFEQSDSLHRPNKGEILLYGSSTMVMWKSYQTDLEGYKVQNRGFGGSQMSDAIHFFDRMVVPLAPPLILLYEGDNDLSVGHKSPLTIYEDFMTFMQMVEQKLPKTKVAMYALRPSIARESTMPLQREINQKLKEYCEKHPKNAFFIDVYDKLLTRDGKPNGDLLLDDKLHLNEKGYEVWTRETREFLKKNKY
jgi:lysophospholipase L1-like esterase